MIQKEIKLTKKQVYELQKLSKIKGKSISELIRQGIDMVIKSNKAIISDEQRRCAVAVAGRFRSGYSNLSTNHDEHLIEVYKK